MNLNSQMEMRALSLLGTSQMATLADWLPLDNQKVDWQPVINTIGQAMNQADEQTAARLRHRLGYIAMIRGDVRTKAIEAFTLVQTSAERLQDARLEAMAHNGLAAAYDTIGERRQSLQHARTAAQFAQKVGDQRLLALALNHQAQFHKENGENRRAYELFQIIGEIGRQLQDDELLMGSEIGLGRTTSMAKAPTAVAHYERAIAMAKARGDEMALATCYNNLSDWKINMGEYAEAIALREQCLRLSQKYESREGIGRALIGMAKAYTLMGELEKARELLNKGFPVVLRAGDLEGDLHASLNLAYLYVRNGDIPRACELYRQVLERSLAAPDHACAVFAQRALELLAEDEMPAPGILPDRPLTAKVLQELTEEELEGVVGGVAGLNGTYPTGDKKWNGG